ncbi:MAG TPA: hypothetical protein VF148_10735 [Acidimicrobiia bacterium]
MAMLVGTASAGNRSGSPQNGAGDGPAMSSMLAVETNWSGKTASTSMTP